MSVIERWTIWPTFVLPGSGEPACVIEGPTVPPRETVEVVRASGYEGAVEALREIAALEDREGDLGEGPGYWAAIGEAAEIARRGLGQ
jgi:hypothetical protein